MTTGKISSIGAEDNGFAVQEQKLELSSWQPAKQAESIKPGASAPGTWTKIERAREAGDSVPNEFTASVARAFCNAHLTQEAVARFAGLLNFGHRYLGLTPQALCFRLLRRLEIDFEFLCEARTSSNY